MRKREILQRLRNVFQRKKKSTPSRGRVFRILRWLRLKVAYASIALSFGELLVVSSFPLTSDSNVVRLRSQIIQPSQFQNEPSDSMVRVALVTLRGGSDSPSKYNVSLLLRMVNLAQRVYKCSVTDAITIVCMWAALLAPTSTPTPTFTCTSSFMSANQFFTHAFITPGGGGRGRPQGGFGLSPKVKSQLENQRRYDLPPKESKGNEGPRPKQAKFSKFNKGRQRLKGQTSLQPAKSKAQFDKSVKDIFVPEGNFTISNAQIRKKFKHASDFVPDINVTDVKQQTQINYNRTRDALIDHVKNHSTVALETVYGRDKATYFFNPTTGLRVIANRTVGSNQLISFWSDTLRQFNHDLKLMNEQHPHLKNGNFTYPEKPKNKDIQTNKTKTSDDS